MQPCYAAVGPAALPAVGAEVLPEDAIGADGLAEATAADVWAEGPADDSPEVTDRTGLGSADPDCAPEPDDVDVDVHDASSTTPAAAATIKPSRRRGPAAIV